MSELKNEEDACVIVVGENDPVALQTQTKRAYATADLAAREYFALPGLKTYEALMAAMGTALTNSKEDFPQDMREVVIQDKFKEYKPKI